MGLQSREILKAFTSMVGARTSVNERTVVCKLRKFVELYHSSWVFNNYSKTSQND